MLNRERSGQHVERSPLTITWMFLMRICNLFSGFALLAILAGSVVLTEHVQADSDFDALLADINFGQVPADNATTLTSSNGTQAPAAPQPLADGEAAVLTMPQAADESLPPPPQPVTDNYSAVADCGGQCGGQCAGQCGSNHCGQSGCNLIKEGFCQPYTPPQLPTSTFYQYWRSNACNTHVWDGFRNRCHSSLDLSGLKCGKGCGHGCGCGACDHVAPAGCSDCGPAPAEWCDQPGHH